MATRGHGASWLPVPNWLNITGLGVLLAHHDLAHSIRSSSRSASGGRMVAITGRAGKVLLRKAFKCSATWPVSTPGSPTRQCTYTSACVAANPAYSSSLRLGLPTQRLVRPAAPRSLDLSL